VDVPRPMRCDLDHKPMKKALSSPLCDIRRRAGDATRQPMPMACEASR
jgi:hypothetical protein